MKRLLITLLAISFLLSGCRLARQTQNIGVETEVATEEPAEAQSTEEVTAAAETVITQEPKEPVAEPDPQAGAWMEIPESVIFFDNFQTGSADQWEVGYGWVVQQNNDIFTFDTVQHGLSYVKGGGDWQNYILRGQVRLSEGTFAVSIYLCSTGRYLLAYNADGLYVIKEIFDTGEMTALARTDAPPLGEWHWMGIAVQDGQIQAGADSELLIDITDPSPLTGGTVAVGAGEGCDVQVDNIIVTELEEPLTTPGELTQAEEFEIPEEIVGESEQPVPDISETEEVIEDEEEEEEETFEPTEESTEEPTEEPTVEPTEESSGADIYIKSVSIPKPWDVNTPLCVTVTVMNNGPEAAGAFTVVWFPNSDGVVGGSWDVPGLAPDGTTTLTLDYPGYAQAGQVTWQAVADTENEVHDPHRSNNTRSGTMNIEQPAPPQASADLYLSVWGGESSIPAGEVYSGHIIVGNFGPDTSDAFNVEWYPFSNGIVGGSWEVLPIAAGVTVELLLEFDGYVDPGEANWSLSIDPIHDTNDPEWGNNTFSGTITIE